MHDREQTLLDDFSSPAFDVGCRDELLVEIVQEGRQHCGLVEASHDILDAHESQVDDLPILVCQVLPCRALSQHLQDHLILSTSSA
jgi:hypothetical protein